MKKRKTRRLKRRKVRKTRKSRKSRKSRKMKGGASPTTTKNRMPSIKKSPESWKDRRFDAAAKASSPQATTTKNRMPSIKKSPESWKDRRFDAAAKASSPPQATTTKNPTYSVSMKSPESWEDRRFDASRAPPLSLREKYRYILNMANAPDWIAPEIASLRRTLDELTDEDLEGLGELQRQLPLWEEFSKIYQYTITH
jgi:hypothetical protein